MVRLHPVAYEFSFQLACFSLILSSFVIAFCWAALAVSSIKSAVRKEFLSIEAEAIASFNFLFASLSTESAAFSSSLAIFSCSSKPSSLFARLFLFQHFLFLLFFFCKFFQPPFLFLLFPLHFFFPLKMISVSCMDRFHSCLQVRINFDFLRLFAIWIKKPISFFQSMNTNHSLFS